MQLFTFSLLLFILASALNSISAKKSGLPQTPVHLKKSNQLQQHKDSPIIVAQGGMSAAEKFNLFQLCMFGFFGVGMQIGMDKMFGPDTPLGPLMKYWTVKSDDPITNWAARMFGTMMICFFAGPKFFGVNMNAYLKQSMVVMLAFLVQFLIVNFQSPEVCAKLTWYPQIGLQVLLCGINWKLLN